MTIQEIQAEYTELANRREQITIEMYRLEGAARVLSEKKEPTSPVDENGKESVDEVVAEKVEEVS